MKIGLVIYGSLETISGGYLYDRKLVELLRSQGDQVEIISLPWRNYSVCLSDNLSRQFSDRLGRLDVDVLLQDELNHPSLFLANERLRRAGLPFPLVTIVHHLRCMEQRPAWQNHFYRWIERCYLNTLDAFIFNSLHTAQSVQALVGPKSPALVAFPAGDRFNPDIGADEITRRQLAPGPLRLVLLGNLIERKNLHTLLEALHGLPADGWELDVIGSLQADPAYSRRVQNLATALGLGQQVRFSGALDDERLAAALRRSQALVVPSSHEGYGIAYLEGMSFGLPAIAGNSGAAAEVIRQGENGWLIAPGDASALRATISALLEDRQLLLKFSLSARRSYLEHPTWLDTTGQIRNFLLALVGGWRPPQREAIK